MPLPPQVISEFGHLQNRFTQPGIASTLIKPEFRGKRLSEINPRDFSARGHNPTLDDELDRALQQGKVFDPDAYGAGDAFSPEDRAALKRYSTLIEVSGSAPGSRYDPGTSHQEAVARQAAEDKRQTEARGGRLPPTEEKKTEPEAPRPVLEPTGRTTYTTAEGKPLSPQEERELAIAFEEHGSVKRGMEAERKGTEKAEREAAERFRLGNVPLPDGKYISLETWEKLPEKYHGVALRQGFKALVDTIEDDQTRYLKAEASLESYKDSKGGYDIARFLRDDPQGEQTLLDAGFTRAAIRQSMDYNRETRGIGAQPGDKPTVSLDQFVETYFADRGWNIDRGKIVRQNKANKLITKDLQAYDEKLSEASGAYREAYGAGAQVLSGLGKVGGFAFAPARVIAPEVELKDVSGLEWAIGGAQLATVAMPFVGGAGRAIISGAAGGVFGYSTAKNWGEISKSPAHAALAIGTDLLVLTPLIGAAAGKVAVGAIKVPVKGGGEVKVWQGLSVGGKPLVGKKYAMPEAGNVLKGYKPETAIETNLLATRKAMTEAGFTEPEIAKVQSTLETRGTFMGKKSPYGPGAEAGEIKSLSQKGVATVLKEAAENPKDVDMVYGSLTIKEQLAPGLREWRKPGDIDIQTKLSQAEAEKFTAKLAKQLERTEGKGNVRISKDTPTLIETRDAEGWHHAVDIHSKETPVNGPPAEYERSIGRTGEYSYGRKVAEPVIKVKYPGVGEVHYMRLSESGVRKADAILQWNEGKIEPPAHRIKDVADYYVILRTFQGEDVANAWAKAYGADIKQLMKIAAENPPKIAAWEFSPKISKAKGSPRIAAVLPASLTAKVSPSVRARVSASVSPYTQGKMPSGYVSLRSGGISQSAKAGYSGSPAGPAPSPSVAAKKASGPVSGRKAPSTRAAVSPVSPKPSKSAPSGASPSWKPSLSPFKAISPSIKAVSPSPGSKPVSPSPGSRPASPPPRSGPTSPPSPPPSKPPPEPPVRPPIPDTPGIKRDATGRIIAVPRGTVSWRQGKLAKPVVKVLVPPYRQQDLLTTSQIPQGAKDITGPKQAFRSVRVTGGAIPKTTQKVTVGFQDVNVIPEGRRSVRLDFNPRRPIGRVRELGADVVRDGRGQHIKLE